MKRRVLLGALITLGALSIVVAAQQPPAAQPAGPRVIDISRSISASPQISPHRRRRR